MRRLRSARLPLAAALAAALAIAAPAAAADDPPAVLEAGPPTRPVPCPARPAGGTPQPRVVEGSLREALGWRPGPADPSGSAAALMHSFRPEDLTGAQEWGAGAPRFAADDPGLAARVTDGLRERTRALLERAIARVDSLAPLRPDDDRVRAANINMGRNLARHQLDHLRKDLDRERANPRAVATRFDELLGARARSVAIVTVLGSLGQLGARLAMEPDAVTSLDDQRHLTRFLAMTDDVHRLRGVFEAAVALERRGKARDPRRAACAALLPQVAAAVHEVGFAMNAVLLGPAERQIVTVCFAGERPMSLSELLEQAERLAAEEGPAWVGERGDEPLAKLAAGAGRLRGLVSGTRVPPQDPERVPAALRTPSVDRALVGLAAGLDALARAAAAD